MNSLICSGGFLLRAFSRSSRPNLDWHKGARPFIVSREAQAQPSSKSTETVLQPLRRASVVMETARTAVALTRANQRREPLRRIHFWPPERCSRPVGSSWPVGHMSSFKAIGNILAKSGDTQSRRDSYILLVPAGHSGEDH